MAGKDLAGHSVKKNQLKKNKIKGQNPCHDDSESKPQDGHKTASIKGQIIKTNQIKDNTVKGKQLKTNQVKEQNPCHNDMRNLSKTQNRWKLAAGLFTSYFRITAFTLGGGMVMLPLMEEEFVHKRKWLTDKEFMDVLTLINTLPGVIAVNSALVVGRKAAGALGAAAAFLGAIIPSILIILILAPLVALIRNKPIAKAAFTAVRAAVAALILLLIFRQAGKMKAGWRELVFAAAALVFMRIGHVQPVLVIPLAAAAGVIVYGKEEKEAGRISSKTKGEGP